MKNSIYQKCHWSRACGALLLFAIAANCNDSFASPQQNKNQRNLIATQANSPNIERKERMDVLNEKERACYVKAIESLINVMQHQENGLREHDEFLGDLTYLYPKAPGKPITFASYQNLLIFNRSTISFRRYENESIWSMARIRKSGSSSKFLPEFSKEMFATMGLVFLKTEAEDGNKNEYFVYQKKSSPKVLVKFYVEASHLADGPGYPKNFEFVDIRFSK